MYRNWSGFFFRMTQFSKFHNIRQQWTRFRAKSFAFPLRSDRRLMLAFASTAGFSFQEHGISDERIKESDNCVDEFVNRKTPGKGWELLYEEKDMLAFRRRIDGPYEMYEYKCVGTYYDISPRTFLDAQNDIEYRRQWDENIITIEVVKEHHENELIRWVSKFPYPMYPREYVYVRRTWVSDDEKYAVVDSESIQPEVFPSKSESNVRVCKYTSRMSIRAHGDWETHGVDYILTYSDNPEANIPRYVYNWMVNKGGPYFLRQVHKAARQIEEKGIEVRSATRQAQQTKNDRVEHRRTTQKDEEEAAAAAAAAAAAKMEQMEKEEKREKKKFKASNKARQSSNNSNCSNNNSNTNSSTSFGLTPEQVNNA